MAEDPEVIATASADDANSYLTDEEADEIMTGFPAIEKWDDLEDVQRARILLTGTRLIDAFKSWGPRKVKTQALAFPRKVDKFEVVPAGVKRALAAYANMCADGDLVPLKTLQAEGVTSATILGQTMNFDKRASMLPSEAVNELEKIFRATWQSPLSKRDGECSLF